MYQQIDTVRFCREKKITVMAYTPLAMNRTSLPAVDILSWHESHGRIPVPMTSSEEHLEENLQRTKLTPDQHILINSVPQGPKMYWDPSDI